MVLTKFHPDHVSTKELVSYGEGSLDPFVRRLAYYVDVLTQYVPDTYQGDPDYWFEDFERESREKDHAVEWAEDELRNANERMQEAEEKYNALLLDNDKPEMFYQNNSLKSRLREEQNKNDSLRHELNKAQDRCVDLSERLTESEAKFHTWKTIAS